MDTEMTKLWISAALALMTTSSQASEVFRFGVHGGTARIEIRPHCHELSCLNLSFRERNSKTVTSKDFSINGSETALIPQPVASPFRATDRPSGPAATAAANISSDADAPANGQVTAPARPANDEPGARRQGADEPTHRRFGPQTQPHDRRPSPPATTTTGEAAAAPSAPTRLAKETSGAPGEWLIEDVARAHATNSASQPSSTSPIGEWLIEDRTAQVRIEACGSNMCGYVSHAENPNDTDGKNPDPALRGRPVIGAKVLLDMKPLAEGWDGNIYNAKDGKTYPAHMVIRDANTLRVEGCALGGLVCRGQNWTRVN
jgi:uncharacterized protein (DUF2147 family)